MAVPKPKEKDVQRQCLDWLRLWGALPVRVNSGARPWTDAKGRRRFFAFNSEPGCSDVLCLLPDGRFAAVECKRPGGALRPAQESFLAAVGKRGGVALVVASLDELRAALAAEGYAV